VRLDVIGCSPAWPNAGGACSGYAVDGGLLLDCGPGVLAKLREREAWPSVTGIAITHLHLDHWGDLVPWVWGCLFGPGAALPRPRLLLPHGARETLGPLLARLGSEDMLERAFEVDEYVDGVPFELAGLQLTALAVPHYDIPAHGFRVEGDRTLAYSGDCGPSDALADLARDADLFLCEATLDDGDADGPPRGHLSVGEADEAFAASGARRMLLTHRPQERSLPDGHELATDGLVVEL